MSIASSFPRRSTTLLLLCLPFVAVPPPLLPRDRPPLPDEIPAWVIAHMASMIGRWVTDNTAYQADDEPFDAYGMEWTWSPGKTSLKGRLFAIQEGREVSTLWEYREVWHPGEQRLMLYQFGRDGTLGVGAAEPLDDHTTRSLQTFYRPDGTTFRVGHRTAIQGDEQHTQSYDVGENGVWTDRRSYVWRRTDRR